MVQFWLCVIVLHIYRNQKSHLRDYRYDFGFLLRKNQQGRRRDIFMRKSRGKKKHQKVCTFQLSLYLMPPGKIMNVILPEV